MHQKLKAYCRNTIPLSDNKLRFVDKFFGIVILFNAHEPL